MAETIVGIVEILVFLFLVCKILKKIAGICGLNEIKDVLGDSLAMRSGGASSRRED